MSHLSDRRSFLALLSALPFIPDAVAQAAATYHAPLAPPEVRTVSAAKDRMVAISRWAARGRRKGVIAFSHGFGSSPGYYPDFIRAWIGAGYEVLAPLHVDSREYGQPGKFDGPAGWAARIEDMRAVSRMIGGDYVAGGHSYGALTALVMCGVDAVVPPGIVAPLADPHATCAIAFSPPGATPTLVRPEGFAKLARPALIQTGTRDIPLAPGTPAVEGWRTHLTAFANAPATGGHYGLVLEGVDHYFGGLICDYSKSGPDQRAALTVATQYSLAFLKAHARREAKDNVGRMPVFPPNPLARLTRR